MKNRWLFFSLWCLVCSNLIWPKHQTQCKANCSIALKDYASWEKVDNGITELYIVFVSYISFYVFLEILCTCSGQCLPMDGKVKWNETPHKSWSCCFSWTIITNMHCMCQHPVVLVIIINISRHMGPKGLSNHKENIVKGTTDSRVEFISQVQTKILIKFYLQNFDQASTSKSQPKISLSIKRKLQNLYQT